MARSRKFLGWAWVYFTTFSPLNVPTAAPRTTSLAQCWSWYIRDNPTKVAPPYITGAAYQVYCGHMRCTSAVTDEATANAVVVWPEGNDCRSDLVPFMNLKSCGLVSALTYGRDRPSATLSAPVIADTRFA